MVAFEDLDLPAVVAMPSWSQSFSARPLAVAVTDRLSRIRTNYDNRLRNWDRSRYPACDRTMRLPNLQPACGRLT